MQVSGVGRVTIDQAMRAMLPPKSQMTGGIKGHDKTPLQAGSVQRPHANEATQHVCSQLGERSSASVFQEMIKGVVYRPGLLLGLSKSVEVVQNLGAAVIEIEIQLPATAELKQIEADPPPNKEPLIVDDQRHKAGIGHIVEPPIELGPEVPKSCCERFAEAYNRPFRRFRSRAWLRTRSRLS